VLTVALRTLFRDLDGSVCDLCGVEAVEVAEEVGGADDELDEPPPPKRKSNHPPYADCAKRTKQIVAQSRAPRKVNDFMATT
jgi:hypothetical protein